MTEQTHSMPERLVERTYVLDDLTVRSDGSGRIVEAYAAVFSKRSEIHDQDGHYQEENSPTSFNRTISHKGPTGFGVLFNHGRTVDGGPNPAATMPIGVPIEVRADSTGVFTATEYLDNPLADWALNAIKKGALRAQSYSGRFLKSEKTYPSGRGKGLPLITRQEVDMREYGPAVFAAYNDAAILGTRAQSALEPTVPLTLFLRSLLAGTPDERLELLQHFDMGTTLATEPTTDPIDNGTPPGPADSADDSQSHSNRSSLTVRDHIRLERKRRGM